MPGTRCATRLRRAAPLAVAMLLGGLVTATPGQAAAADDCTIFWSGASSTVWSDSGNWSVTDSGSPAGRTPAATDVVCRATAATGAVVRIRDVAAAAAIRWPETATGDPAVVSVSAGAVLTLAGPTRSTVARLEAGRARLDGAGSLEITRSGTADFTTFALGALTTSGDATLTGVTLDGTRVTNPPRAFLTVVGDLRFVRDAALVNAGSLRQNSLHPDREDVWSGAGSVTNGVPGADAVLFPGPSRRWRVDVPFLNRASVFGTLGPTTFTRLVNLRDGVLEGGRWGTYTSGRFDLGGPVTTLAAGTRIADSGGGLAAVASQLTTVAGSIDVEFYDRYHFDRPLTVAAGGRLSISDPATFHGLEVAGDASLTSPTVTAPGVHVLATGTLRLPFGITGSVVNEGTLVAPLAFSRLPPIDGTYRATASSTTVTDTLRVTGTATLAGTLTLVPDLVLTPGGDPYLLVRAAGLIGRFDRLNLRATGTVTPTYTATRLTVTVRRAVPGAAPPSPPATVD